MKSPEKMESTFDQQKHPELLEGEMWITNSQQAGNEVVYNSKRVGTKAYDTSGNEARGLVPVFISKEEYEQRKKERGE